MYVIVYTLLLLGLLGLIGALVLYFTAKKFHVDEHPQIEAIASLLPGANCGGCGFKGCRDFAAACVSRGNLDGIFCPVTGADGMERIAGILGVKSDIAERRIAVLKCNGTCEARPLRYTYDGVRSCRVMDAVSVGARGCAYGCLGCGDCVDVCRFGAIKIDTATGIAVVDPEKCTACGACVSECPRHLLELRPVGKRDRRVWVACSSRDKGPVARKICINACIGCGKCVRTCPFGAIDLNANLAYINPDMCKACGKCIAQCPVGAIHATFNPITPKTTAANDKDI